MNRHTEPSPHTVVTRCTDKFVSSFYTRTSQWQQMMCVHVHGLWGLFSDTLTSGFCFWCFVFLSGFPTNTKEQSNTCVSVSILEVLPNRRPRAGREWCEIKSPSIKGNCGISQTAWNILLNNFVVEVWESELVKMLLFRVEQELLQLSEIHRN